MKLRGKNYKRTRGQQKKKLEKTLKRMEKIRKNDNKRLRKSIKDKLEWAIDQKKKGLEAIERFKQSIQINTKEIWKLEGIILAFTQILEEDNKGKK